MGHYTELKLDVLLGAGTPSSVIAELGRMVTGDGTGEGRRAWMLTGSSAYFDGWETPTLTSVGIYSWRLTCCCNLKNYENEIEWFLDWIAPYVVTDQQAGHIWYESSVPIPIWFHGGKVSLNAPGITAEEALARAANSPLEQPWRP